MGASAAQLDGGIKSIGFMGRVLINAVFINAVFINLVLIAAERTYNLSALKTGQRVQDPVSPLPQFGQTMFKTAKLPPASGDLSGRTAHFETWRSKCAHSGKSSS